MVPALRVALVNLKDVDSPQVLVFPATNVTSARSNSINRAALSLRR